MDLTSLFNSPGAGGDSSLGKSSATSSFDLSSHDTSTVGIDQSYLLIGALGLGLLTLLIVALKK